MAVWARIVMLALGWIGARKRPLEAIRAALHPVPLALFRS